MMVRVVGGDNGDSNFVITCQALLADLSKHYQKNNNEIYRKIFCYRRYFKYVDQRQETIETRGTPLREPCKSRQICRGHPLSWHNLYCKCITRKCLTWKWRSNWWSTISAMASSDGKYQNLYLNFCAIFQHFRYISISYFFNHDNLGQGQRVQHSQWCDSVANTNLYKTRPTHFY